MAKSISKILQDRALSEHVKTDYPLFISFLDAYLEYMEEPKNPHDIAINLRNYRDIDTTLDEFIDYFAREVMVNIPSDILADKRLLIKHIKEFYLNKGNKSSYRFLFRIIYNEDIEFYYPKNDILRASDGKWYEQKSIKVTISDPFNLTVMTRSSAIAGQTSGATAVIENSLNFVDRGTDLVELPLSHIRGDFIEGEQIAIEYTDDDGETQEVYETIYTIYTEIDITAGGSGYSVDQLLIVRESGGDEIAKGAITQVTKGPITSLSIDAAGTDYNGTVKEVTRFYALPGTWTLDGDYLPDTPADGSDTGSSGNDYTAYTFDEIITLQSVPGTGDSIEISDSSTSFGTGAYGIVSKVGNDGEITEATLLAEGTAYDSPTAEVITTTGINGEISPIGGGGSILTARLLDFPIVLDGDYDTSGDITAYPDFSNIGDGNATGELLVGALAEYPGRYLNEDGHLSSSKRLQDNFFYQDYSYVIKVGLAIDGWRDIIKKIIHPAGLALFGEVQFLEVLDSSVSMVDSHIDRISEVCMGEHSAEMIDTILEITVCGIGGNIDNDWEDFSASGVTPTTWSEMTVSWDSLRGSCTTVPLLEYPDEYLLSDNNNFLLDDDDNYLIKN